MVCPAWHNCYSNVNVGSVCRRELLALAQAARCLQAVKAILKWILNEIRGHISLD